MPMPLNNPIGILGNAEAVLWDFDGVLLDSMPVRNNAFLHVLRGFPDDKVSEILEWHMQNGGLSRYVKFRRFQTAILGHAPDETQIQTWSLTFSEYCKRHLVNKNLLVPSTNNSLPILSGRVPMHIVSGSDGDELRGLCHELDLSSFFVSIEGSPTPKIELVANILQKHGYTPRQAWLVGDSHNDYEAAAVNGLNFMGFGNESLKTLSQAYWDL